MWCYPVQKEVSHAGFLETQRENAKLELSKISLTLIRVRDAYIECKVSVTDCCHSCMTICNIESLFKNKQKKKRKKESYFLETIN